MKIIYIILLYIMIITFSIGLGCKKTIFQLDINELQNYFETSDIHAKANETSVLVEVSNSTFIQRERLKKGTKWNNAEAYASIGALITSTHIDSIYKIDTLTIDIKSNNSEEVYKYRMDDLKKVRTFVDVSRNFLTAWSDKDFTKVQSYLGNEILNIYPTVDGLKQALSPVFLDNKINKSELIAFKISSENIASLYVNAYYDNGKAQTYIFNFFLSDDDKISGITVP